ncbi:MAG: CRISPR system precrRNA processing endoribonuclease RAMP protein Cas6 [Firmicutes bacterium]|nr:CRISPR system precrRNA processing endoribonuclease RAMP protein Cas6 [Bacillota bacterium]
MEHEMLEDLTLSRSNFTLEVTQPITLSEFTGSTLRGAFGTMLRKTVCAQRYLEDCKECYLKNCCAYAAIFTPGNLPGSKFFPGNEQLPRSFTFYIKEEKTSFSAGEEINLVLTLIGKTAEYFPYFFIVLQELGRQGFGLRGEKGERGGFEIKKITDELAPETKTIFDGTTKASMPPLHREKLKNLLRPIKNISLLKVHFITPLRVKWQGRLCSDIQFHILLRNALRRLSALYFLSENKPLDLDYRLLISQAEEIETLQADFKWEEYSRYSGRQKERMKLGGVTGWAIYKGVLSPFFTFLQAAELMSVGKGTTFGFGRILLETLEKGG